MDTVTLSNLGKEIQQMEGRLTAMRGEFENRQKDLGKLEQRKEQLQATLQNVESEIASLVGDVNRQAAKAAGGAAKTTAPSKTGRKRGRPKGSGKKKTQLKTKPAAPKAGKRSGATLRDVVTDILRSARKPLKTKELADRALESGYQTKSGNFTAVVQDLIRKMDNLERVKNQGYQLKR